MSAGDLAAFIADELFPRLGPEQVYTWPGHGWHKARDRWRGACPWHESQSGTSFVVSLDSLRWYCAGCGAGGSPLEYRYRLRGGSGPRRGDDVPRVLEALAGIAGIVVPAANLSPEQLQRALERQHRAAGLGLVYQHCERMLWTEHGEPARAYLHVRGLDDDAIKELELGLYADLPGLNKALRRANLAAVANHGSCPPLEAFAEADD